MVIFMFMLFAFSVVHKVQFISLYLLHRSSFSALLSLQDFRDNNFYLDSPY